DDERAITIHSGRYGPYLKYGATNVTIPESIDPEKITLDEAVELIAAKTSKGKKKTTRSTAKPRKTATGRNTTSRAPARKKTSRRKAA
ncbi:MAG: DNA topoisomerase I, partial [Gammaproteobacteria bacterium]|nr:DNA topoisomerase I [Gammaproteobacteria bacterium]